MSMAASAVTRLNGQIGLTAFSASFAYEPTPLPTTTSVTVPASSVYGQTVTFTATTIPGSLGGLDTSWFSGSVQFIVDGCNSAQA